MALGDGIRRDVALIPQAERDRFLAAIVKLDTTLLFPDGVTYWDKQEEVHVNGHESGLDVHSGPAFVAWHRALCNKFEELLREADPQLSLHYWNWTTDPRSTAGGRANLFTPAFMGRSSGNAGNPGEPLANFETTDPGHAVIWRDVGATAAKGDGSPDIAADADILNHNNWTAFEQALHDAHDFTAHSYIGGTITNPHFSFHDPFVFLLHSNMDRLWAMWQAGDPARYTAATAYGAASGAASLNTEVQPWAGGTGLEPWASGARPQDHSTYKSNSILSPPCYDTLPVAVNIVESENPVDAMTHHGIINFNSVPEGELAIRAAVFHVFGCGDITFEIVAGSGPAAPYAVYPPGATSVTVHHTLMPFTEARMWFSFRGIVGGAGTAAAAGSVTIRCNNTGQTFTFDLRADTIARQTVAAVLALDQSASMNDPAGVAGATRIGVLHEAAAHFVSLVRANNGVGMVRFDQDAYPPGDPTWPGLAIRRVTTDDLLDSDRQAALTAVGNHAVNPAGWTSIGDGVVMAHNTLNGLPATGPGSYDRKAIVVFTDGLENRDAFIQNVMGSIDARTFAIGLGDSSQVSASALTALTNGTGGYLLLTGVLSAANQDDRFRLTKYFIQILAGVTNNSVILDPTGYIPAGAVVRIPFFVTEADLDLSVVLLNDPAIVTLEVETPDGTIIDPAAATAAGGSYGEHGTLRYYKLNLPVPTAGGAAHGGKWFARLEIDRKLLDRLRAQGREAATLQAHGALYSVVVQSYSSIKLNARMVQSSLEPGATLTVRAALTEYDLPIEHRATMFSDVERPDGTKTTMPMNEVEPGVFEGSMPGALAGTYRFRVQASGATRQGLAFTREQQLTAPVVRGGDGPFPVGGNEPSGGQLLPEPPSSTATPPRDECCNRISRVVWIGIALLLLILLVLLFKR